MEQIKSIVYHQDPVDPNPWCFQDCPATTTSMPTPASWLRRYWPHWNVASCGVLHFKGLSLCLFSL